MMVLPLQVNTALELLHRAGYEAYLVGGAVRDYVRRGLQGEDWDITTSALPEEVEQVFSTFRVIETGLKHGTVTVVMDHMHLEITTYRTEGSYSDHRHPDSVCFTRSLREDLARRDFTMNALAYSPKTGVVDLYGGCEDIAAGLVRCVGDPDRRFQEDALRILRALRFASVYELVLEEQTARAVHRNRALLDRIAPERIRVELTKLLCGAGVETVLREYADVLAQIIPELAPMFGFEQKNPHHDRDVWEHTIAVVAHAPAEPVMRWSALLHDIGKPKCFTEDEEGIGHFYGHAGIGDALAEEVLGRLRFDNAARQRIRLLVKNHDTPLPQEEKGVKRLLNRFGPEAVEQLIRLHRADTAGQHPCCARRQAQFDRVTDLVQVVLARQACFSLKDLAVRGGDLIHLGLSGRQVGEALQTALEAVMDGRVANERGALLSYLGQSAEEKMEDEG